MLHARGLTALAIAAAATATMITPAAAESGKEARYAWVDACTIKKDYTVPCGPWTLSLRGGGSLALKDAVVNPRLANGKVEKEASAPVSISGNGRFVGYFRKSDGRLVVRNLRTGTVKALPGKAATVPKGLGMSDLDTAFSDSGRKFAIDYFDEAAKLKSLVVDLETDTITTFRGDEAIQGFSPDGEHVLTSRTTEDNTTEFAVYDESGNELESRVVPQIVSNNAPIALAADGTTVAMVITGPKPTSKARLRTYDLSTDQVSDPVALGYPTGNEFANRLVWDGSGGLTLWTYRTDREGNPTAAIKRHVDPETGTTSKRDTFAIRAGVWTWWLPGD